MKVAAQRCVAADERAASDGRSQLTAVLCMRYSITEGS
jgi:hypothetical protein